MLRFNQFTGTNIVPLLARLILCAAFLTMGWNKVMNTQVFTGEDARILLELDVAEGDHAATAVVEPASLQGRSLREDIAERNREEAASQDAAESEEDEDAAAEPPPTGDESEIEPEEFLPPDVESLTAEAKKLHSVTVLLYKKDWRTIDPAKMAWVAALTELFGGALLLVGLFARVWGLGLAIAMAVAFYLTSLPLVLEQGVFGLTSMNDSYAAYNRVYTQLGLFSLAFGVFLTGAGAISLDRLLFRPAQSTRTVAEIEEYEE